MHQTNTLTRTSGRLAVAAALAVAIAAPGATARAQEPLKIGFVYVTPIGDAGWTYRHDVARKAMEKALGGRVETKYGEKVPECAEARGVSRELAASGCKLIFTTSFG